MPIDFKFPLTKILTALNHLFSYRAPFIFPVVKNILLTDTLNFSVD